MPIPEELKGKSPDEIYDLLRNAHEEEVAAVRKDMIDKIPQLQPQKVPDTTAVPTQQPQTYQPPFTGGAGTAVDDQSIYTNPDAFVDTRVQRGVDQATEYLAAIQRPANEKLFVLNLDTDDKELYDTYKDEINANVNSLPLRTQIDPRAFEMAFQVVIGKHRKEIEKTRFEKQAESLVKTTLRDKVGMADEEIEAAFTNKEPPPVQRRSLFQPVTGVAVNTPQPRYGGVAKMQTPKISEVQRKIARGFGMSDEAYMAAFAAEEGEE